MEKVIFDYNGEKITIFCEKNEKMEEIIERFKAEKELQNSNLFFIKGAKEVSKLLTFDQLANSFDKENKTINILVFEKN